MYKEFQIFYYQEISIKDSMDKAKRGLGLMVEGGSGWVGQGRVLSGKCRQLYLTNKKKKETNNPIINILGLPLYG